MKQSAKQIRANNIRSKVMREANRLFKVRYNMMEGRWGRTYTWAECLREVWAAENKRQQEMNWAVKCQELPTHMKHNSVDAQIPREELEYYKQRGWSLD